MNEENLVFKSLHVSHLSHDGAMSLFQSTYVLALPLREHIGTTANAILTELIENTDTCRAQTHRPRKSPLSETVKTLRKTCNDQLAEMKRTISFSAKSSNDTLNKAGKMLKLFFSPNWNIQKEALHTQIEITALILEKYHADPNVVAAGQTIGIDSIVTQLQTTNAELEKIFSDRIEETSSRPASGTELRPAANESYMQFCTAIEQAARYTPNNEVIELFNVMNVHRKTAHKLLARKKKEVSNNE